MSSLNIRNKINELKNSKVLKDSLIYTSFNFIEKALPFLVLPILARNLTKEAVGLYILYQAIIEIMTPIMTLSIDNSILINYYKLKYIEFKKYFFNGFLLFIFCFAITFSGGFFFKDSIAEVINFPSFWLPFIAITIFFRFFTQNRQNIWRIQFEIKKYGILTLGISFVNNTLGICLVLFTGLGWLGMIVGHFIGYFIFGAFAIYSFYKEGFFSFKKQIYYLKDIYKMSYPIAIHRFGVWLGSAGNKMIISAVLGTIATGSYGVGAVFATIVNN